MDGSTSGSALTVAGYRRSKQAISTRAPTSGAGSQA